MGWNIIKFLEFDATLAQLVERQAVMDIDYLNVPCSIHGGPKLFFCF
jgi:hypothetical protein